MQATNSRSESRKSFQDEITFIYPGDYFGEEKFLRSVERSSRTFVAVNEVTLCVISQALFDDDHLFGAVRVWMKNDVSVRERVQSVRILRKQRSLMQGLGRTQSCKTVTTSSLESVWALGDEAPPRLTNIVRKSSVVTVSSDDSSPSDDAGMQKAISTDNSATCDSCSFDVICCSLSHDSTPKALPTVARD